MTPVVPNIMKNRASVINPENLRDVMMVHSDKKHHSQTVMENYTAVRRVYRSEIGAAKRNANDKYRLNK